MKIAFVTKLDPSFMDKVIEWATNSKYYHCFLITDSNINGNPVTIEASLSGGIKLNLLTLESNSEVFQCNFDFNDISVLYPYINSRYGIFHALGFGLNKLFNLKNNPITGDLICSGVVDTWLRASPASVLFDQLAVNNATPGNVYDIVSSSKLFTKL